MSFQKMPEHTPCESFRVIPVSYTHLDVYKRQAQYLTEIRDAGVDTLILGCTHYPLLRCV